MSDNPLTLVSTIGNVLGVSVSIRQEGSARRPSASQRVGKTATGKIQKFMLRQELDGGKQEGKGA